MSPTGIRGCSRPCIAQSVKYLPQPTPAFYAKLGKNATARQALAADFQGIYGPMTETINRDTAQPHQRHRGADQPGARGDHAGGSQGVGQGKYQRQRNGLRPAATELERLDGVHGARDVAPRRRVTGRNLPPTCPIHAEGSVRMMNRSPAPWPLAPVALFPVPAPSAAVEDRIVSVVRHSGRERAAAVAAAPGPGPRDLEFSGVVSPVSLGTLTGTPAHRIVTTAQPSIPRRDRLPHPGPHNPTDVALHLGPDISPETLTIDNREVLINDFLAEYATFYQLSPS